MNPKKNLYSLLLLCLLSAQWAVADPALAEKRKTFVKLYDVDVRDNLHIDNQFGHVKVALWDRNEIRVDISITANAPGDEQAQRYLDAVKIVEARTGDQISLKTVIDKANFNGNNANWVIWKKDGKKEGEKSGLQIDYQISMPKNNALTVRNQFGNTTIPSFRASLTVANRHGGFYATDLKGDKVDIDVQFGNAEIREMDNGKLDIQYAKLVLDKANVLTLNNRFGKMVIGDVNRLDANIGYSGGSTIGTLKESCKLKLDFSNGFQIGQLPRSVESVDIQASYSSMVLPIASESNSNFDVTIQYGNFRYPTDNSRILLKTGPDDPSNRHQYKSTKQYTGQVGKGSGTRVRVVSRFGDVKFQ